LTIAGGGVGGAGTGALAGAAALVMGAAAVADREVVAIVLIPDSLGIGTVRHWPQAQAETSSYCLGA
jgi:hypothetical protein